MTNQRKVSTFLICLLYLWGSAALLTAADQAVTEEKPAASQKEKEAPPEKETPEEKKPEKAAPEKADEESATPSDETEDPKKVEDEEIAVAVARPVSADPVQIYGWREYVTVSDGKLEERMKAKLDTGALTSSIHAEEKELFERDGKKWVRFVVVDPSDKDSKRLRIEAPLVRIARIKEPGGESESREVVRLGFVIGDRKLKADFTLNNRSNMLSPVLIGRRTIKELGWVDSSRAYLADKKLMR
ncbi:RimK/LysX family protein [Haloferula sp.]|uniref:ATP-dependent zinc protease family protein n=1 Tax=Haloferula sp. TaxID=2497595 RepID=UPI003C70CA4E